MGIDGKQSIRKAYCSTLNAHGSKVYSSTVRAICVNSCTNPCVTLAACATYTSSWVDTNGYVNGSLLLRSDTKSATNGVVLQHSIDGSAVDHEDQYTYMYQCSGVHYNIPLVSRYVRAKFTNNGCTQCLFRMQLSLYSHERGEHVDCETTSIVNSTTSPLAACATFTGIGEKNSYSQVGIMLKTDQPGTLYFDFSSDGTNWDSTFPVAGFQVYACIPEFHTAIKLGRYFRTRFTNTGCCTQSYMRLSTYYGCSFTPTVAPLNQSISRDGDSITVRPSDFGDEVVIGRRGGVRSFNNFSQRLNLQSACGEQTVWEASGNFTPMTTASTFTIAYCSTNCGACDIGARTLFIDYVDACGEYKIGTHTLSTTGSDVTSFTGLGINRIAVSSSGSSQTNVGAITATSTCAGTIQAYISAGLGTSSTSMFHVDSNSDAIVSYLWINANKLSGGSAPKITVKGFVFNRTIQTRFQIFKAIIDTSIDNFFSITDPEGFKLSPTDVLYFVADTDTNNSSIILRFSLREYKRS